MLLSFGSQQKFDLILRGLDIIHNRLKKEVTVDNVTLAVAMCVKYTFDVLQTYIQIQTIRYSKISWI